MRTTSSLLAKYREQPTFSDWRIIRLFQWILSNIQTVPIANIASLMMPEIEQAQKHKETVYLAMHGLDPSLKEFLISKGIKDTDCPEARFEVAIQKLNRLNDHYPCDRFFWENEVTVSWLKEGYPSNRDQATRDATPLHQKAREWFEHLTERSSAADRYESDIVCELERIAELGHAQANLYLARWYENRYSVVNFFAPPPYSACGNQLITDIRADDPNRAFQHMKRVAEYGDNVTAMKRMEQYYHSGFGCQISSEDAGHWYRMHVRLAALQRR